MQIKTAGTILILTLTLSGCIHLTPTNNQNDSANTNNSTTTTQPQNQQTNTAPNQQIPGSSGYSGKILAGSNSPLLDFNQQDYQRALKSDKLVLLYFYASWCPICRQETQEALYPAFNELQSDQVIGFRINFKDTDTDEDEQQLARDYDVPYQHFKVFIKNGKVLTTSPQQWNKSKYLQQINSNL